MWARLRLTPGQIVALTGLTHRQVTYWSEQGILHRDEEGFDGYALEKAILIRQALDSGFSLRLATRLAEDYMQEQSATFESASLAEWVTQLREIEDLIRAVRMAMGG